MRPVPRRPRCQLLDDDLGLLLGGAGAAQLGPLPGRATAGCAASRPRIVTSSVTDGPAAGRGVVAAQAAGAVALAGDLAVEGEAEGVEDGGLARAGRPVDQEQARLGRARRSRPSPDPGKDPNAVSESRCGRIYAIVSLTRDASMACLSRSSSSGRRARRAPRGRSRARPRSRAGPLSSCGPRAADWPPSGSKERASVCGKRARSRSMAALGRIGSVSTTCSQWSS